jgi:hypothetical protein
MHIIQFRTIGPWKSAQKWFGKSCLWYLVNFHAFYEEWGQISRTCVARVNHKRDVYWFFNSRKLKNMPEKHDTWHGATIWPQHAVVIFLEGSANVVIHALHKSNHHKGSSWCQEGNHQVRRWIQISFVVCPRIFFYDQHTPWNAPCSNLALFWANLLYLGHYGHFLGIYAHNSNSHDRCM